MSISGKLVVLTGASGGIGHAIARRLAQQGARLILIGRSGTKLEAIGKELHIFANHGFVLQADITTSAGRETIRTALVAMNHPIDVMINCAGVNLFGFLPDNDPAAIEKLIATNVTAPLLLTRLVIPHLNPDDGRIINIGSSFGALGYPGFSAYCASKFALRGFTEALRRELSDTKLQIAHLAPRATDTDLNSDAVCAMNKELGNAMDNPDVVALAVERMLKAKRMRDRNIGWPERLFLRINSIFPQLIDNALRNQLPVIRRYASSKTASPRISLSRNH